MKSFIFYFFILSSFIITFSFAGYHCNSNTGICNDIFGNEKQILLKNNINENFSHHSHFNNNEFSPFVNSIISNLSLREKIGQMTQLDVSVVLNQTSLANGFVSLNKTALEYGIKNYGVGSYLNSPYAGGKIGPISGWNATEWAYFMLEFKQLAVQYSNKSLPIIYGLDSVHGANYVYGATMFPHNIGCAATFDPTLVKMGSGTIAARDTRLSGISWQFAPVLGIGINPLWPRFYETFGEDPYLVSEMGKNIVQSIENNNLNSQVQCSSCCKHYFGYSNPKSGKDRTDAWMGQRQLYEYFLPPFIKSLNYSGSLMINSGSINEIPVHSSKEYLTSILRNKLLFQGVAVTDYQDIEKLVFYYNIVETYKEATYLAVEAGIDMSMVPFDYSFSEDLYNLVMEGKITEERIDNSVMRILQLKENLGLFSENYYPNPHNPLIDNIGSEEDWNLASDIARKSITLLKNDDNILPLPLNLKKILLTGPAANSRGVQSGGWSIHWQGAEDDEFPYGSSIYDGIIDKTQQFSTNVVLNEGVTFTDVIDISSVINDAEGSDVIIICLGEAAEAETVGDINDLTLSAPQIELYTSLLHLNIPIIVVLVEARPRILGPVSSANAIFNCYLPGPIGGEVLAELLFGEYSPSGRLPFTYPQYTGDIGVPYYHMYSASTFPLYEFGFGLSYTSFSYSNLLVPKIWNITSENNIQVQVTVTNTGSIESDEIVLLYVSDLYRIISPEVKRLRKFERIHLKPSESKTLSWLLSYEDVEFIGRELQPTIEEGEFTISISNLSNNFVLTL